MENFLMFLRCKREKLQKLWLMSKWTFLFVFLGIINTHGTVYSQNEQQVTISMKNAYLKDILWAIQRQTTFVFMYHEEDLDKVGKVNVEAKASTVEKILSDCLKGTGLTYVFQNEVIVLKPLNDEKKKEIKIVGKVVDKGKMPLPGVTVVVKGTNLGTATDSEGKYRMVLPAMRDTNFVLVFSFVGMRTQEIKYVGLDSINVVMEEDHKKMDEVVVTGYSNIRKESFTGKATTVTKEQLMKVNSKNVIAALQTFDPSFRIKDNKLWGSDPNALPEFNIRGETSIGQTKGLDVEQQKRTQRTTLENNPNLPVFILDGFEVDVQKIYDLDVNRIESITILKDAAATAMYGSQAANGVVVVTTVAPKPGEMQIYYNFSGNVDFPDLSDYNLCDAAEKLEVERLSGLYSSDDPEKQIELTAQYYKKQNAILRGVNTDWMSQPLRNAFGHMHSLNVSGGEESIRYGIDLNYNASKNGVMKGSFRHIYGGGLTLDYRAGSWLQLLNNISYTVTESEDSPYGQYTQYAEAQPYAEIYDENGRLLKEVLGTTVSMINPLWKVANLSTFYGKMKNRDLTNNFQLNIHIMEGLMFKGQLGLRRTDGRTDNFKDPADPVYDVTPADQKGELSRQENDNWSWNGKMMFYYNHVFGNHFINATAGGEISESKTESLSYVLNGFQLGNMHEPQFAATQARPVNVSESKTRKIGFLASVNYAYNDIYLFDGSFRLDGSSDFGSDKQFAPFWSVGAGLNVHNYDFLKGHWLISRLKLRASYGSTGNVGFAPYSAITTFQTATDAWFFTGPAASLMALGNSRLTWQTTYKLDAGFNIGLLNDKITLEGSYYRNETEDLIDDVKIPAYSGFTSYKENSGATLNEGFEVALTSTLFQNKDWMVTFMANLSSNRSKITELSEEMNAYNETILAEYEKEDSKYKAVLSRPLILYYEGKSLSAIYAVRSEGIDPANGRERFVKKNGMSTYTWDANDQVVVGDTEPDAKGSFGINVAWKGITLNAYFNYQWGGQSYNSTLAEKVENAQVSTQNVDKRVLSARWKNAGDVVPYYDLSKNPTQNPTSRFVQDDNRLDFTSLSIGYDFSRQLISKWKLKSLSVQFSANDLCKWRSVKEERAINYPFARSFNFSLNVGF